VLTDAAQSAPSREQAVEATSAAAFWAVFLVRPAWRRCRVMSSTAASIRMTRQRKEKPGEVGKGDLEWLRRSVHDLQV
jgi:hypothetical protein